MRQLLPARYLASAISVTAQSDINTCSWQAGNAGQCRRHAGRIAPAAPLNTSGLYSIGQYRSRPRDATSCARYRRARRASIDASLALMLPSTIFHFTFLDFQRRLRFYTA